MINISFSKLIITCLKSVGGWREFDLKGDWFILFSLIIFIHEEGPSSGLANPSPTCVSPSHKFGQDEGEVSMQDENRLQ